MRQRIVTGDHPEDEEANKQGPGTNDRAKDGERQFHLRGSCVGFGLAVALASFFSLSSNATSSSSVSSSRAASRNLSTCGLGVLSAIIMV